MASAIWQLQFLIYYKTLDALCYGTCITRYTNKNSILQFVQIKCIIIIIIIYTYGLRCTKLAYTVVHQNSCIETDSTYVHFLSWFSYQ